MKPFLKFGLCAAFAALVLGSVYAYMGNPRIIGPDAVISASTVTNRMVDEITLTGQWKYEFTTPPDTEITNEFNPISASAAVKWSVTPALDGSGFSAALGGPYSTNVSHVNPVYFSVLSGGVYTVTLTATSDLFQTEQVNVLYVTELHADIVPETVVVAAGTTNIPFPLTPESYGSMSWTLTPELEDGAAFVSTSDTGAFVDAGTVATSYVVQVVTPALTTCWDTAILTVITNYTIVASSLYIALSNTVTATSWTVDGNGTAVKTNSDWTIPQGDDKVRYLSGTNLLTSTTGVDTVTIMGISASSVTNDVRVHAVASGNSSLLDDEWFTILKVDIVETNVYVGVTNTTTLHLTPDSSTNVQWEITPSVQNGASIIGSALGTSIVFNAGLVATNYTVWAYAVNLTNCYDTCAVTILKVDLDIDVDDDGDKDAADEAAEDSAPGGIVFVNWDDDNNNGTCDYESSETSVSGENELVSVGLKIEPTLSTGTATLEASSGGSRIKVWETANKTGPVSLPKSWNLASETLPSTLYVEAIDKSSAEGDTVLNLKWVNGGTIVCNDQITLTCVKINLALAAYRSPVEPWPFSPDFNHAVIVSGYGGTGPYGIDAAEGSGRRQKSQLLTLANYHIMEMPGAGQAAVASTLQGLVDQHDPTGWPGAGHEYLVSNPGLASHDDLRNQILDNTEAVQAAVNGYCWNDAVEGPSNTLWNGTIAGIENLRCDGLVEVVYELAGVQVWGRDGMNYPIQTYPAEHNTIGMTLDPDRLSPIVQRGGVTVSPTRFEPQPLVEPSTMEPHE